MVWFWKSNRGVDKSNNENGGLLRDAMSGCSLSVDSVGSSEEGSETKEFLRARIVGRSFARDTNRQSIYVIYKIAISRNEDTDEYNPDGNEIVWRRYSDFQYLYTSLRDFFKGTNTIVPSLPGKKYFGRLDPEFLDRRQSLLDIWLQEVCTRSDLLASIRLVEIFLSVELAKHRPVGSNSYGDPTEFARACGPVSLEDFEAIRVIGRGSFGRVLVVKRHESPTLFAMEVLKKSDVQKRKQVEHIKTERRIMARTNHPFIVHMYYAFQTKSKLYLVLEYVPGGELFFHLGRFKRFQESWTVIWTAEIVLALEHLHSLDIVFRDLKPENILFDAQGHIKLVDFGLSKDFIEGYTSGSKSFCGTPEYLAPEVLDRVGHGKAVDFWSLGMVLFEMLTGLPPWYTRNKKKLFDRLRHAPLKFPDYVSTTARNLIKKLLVRDPNLRLGVRGYDELKSNPFFVLIDWDKLYHKQIKPGFVPNIRMCDTRASDPAFDLDTSNFDSAFTELPIYDSDVCDDDGTVGEEANRDTVHSDDFQRPVVPSSHGNLYHNFSFSVC